MHVGRRRTIHNVAPKKVLGRWNDQAGLTLGHIQTGAGEPNALTEPRVPIPHATCLWCVSIPIFLETLLPPSRYHTTYLSGLLCAVHIVTGGKLDITHNAG